jgi:RND family efflux transporter MFP subunit
MRLKLLAIVLLFVVAGGAVAYSVGGFGAPTAAATSLLTATASVTNVTDEVAATGTVVASQTFSLAFGAQPVTTSGSSSSASSPANSSVTWPVTTLNVAVGDQVTQGEVLAAADTTDLEAQITDAKRSDLTAGIQLKQAQDQLTAASGTSARRQAKIGLYSAESGKDKADQALADLVAQRAEASLTAPGAGIVTAVNIQVGANAPSGAAITIESADLDVSTSVVESDVARISEGQKASIAIAAVNATIQGTVTSIAPSASSAGNGGVVSYPVMIALDAPPTALRSGMSADVTIVTATASNVVAIPSRALSGSAGNYTVRVVASDGTVQTRAVTVGLITSSLAEIQSGLQAGEQVVTGTSSAQNGTTQGVFGGGQFRGAGLGGAGSVITR